MPPRYSYWTIIAGGLPTAFRAAEREELLPTFTRLREKHPDAEMKWFSRGKLWDSREAARQEHERGRFDRPRDARGRAPRPPGNQDDGQRAQRRPDWRPGGEHRDPRQKYADAKKARNAEHRKLKFARKHGVAPDGAKRAWNGPREGGSESRGGGDRGPAQGREPRQSWRKPHDARGGPPKRAWSQPREGQNRPREGGNESRGGGFDRRPSGPEHRQTWRRPPDARGATLGAPKREWNKPREGGSKRAWNQPREGGNKTREGGNESRGGGFDRRPSGPEHRQAWKRPPDARGATLGAPKREWNKPREGGPKRAWNQPREGGSTARESGRDGGPRKRPFERRGFERNQGTEEPPDPPRPRGPNREPRPSETPEPTPPPRPTEPVIAPPGPPERGRLNKRPHRRS